MNYEEKRNILNKSGYSILELLLAMVIISTIASGIIPLFFSAISANKASKDKFYAYEAAHSEIEKMRADTFSNITSHNFSIPNMSTATGNVTVDNNIDGTPRTDIVKVTTNVDWDYKGKDEQISLITYIAKQGINQ